MMYHYKDRHPFELLPAGEELRRLIAEGQAEADRGELFDGETVFQMLLARNAVRRTPAEAAAPQHRILTPHKVRHACSKPTPTPAVHSREGACPNRAADIRLLRAGRVMEAGSEVRATLSELGHPAVSIRQRCKPVTLLRLERHRARIGR